MADGRHDHGRRQHPFHQRRKRLARVAGRVVPTEPLLDLGKGPALCRRHRQVQDEVAAAQRPVHVLRGVHEAARAKAPGHERTQHRVGRRRAAAAGAQHHRRVAVRAFVEPPKVVKLVRLVVARVRVVGHRRRVHECGDQQSDAEKGKGHCIRTAERGRAGQEARSLPCAPASRSYGLGANARRDLGRSSGASAARRHGRRDRRPHQAAAARRAAQGRGHARGHDCAARGGDARGGGGRPGLRQPLPVRADGRPARARQAHRRLGPERARPGRLRAAAQRRRRDELGGRAAGAGERVHGHAR